MTGTLNNPTVAADLNMATHKITNLADAAAAGDAVSRSFGDARFAPISGAGRPYFSRGGAAGAIATSIAAGQTRYFNPYGVAGNNATENLMSSVPPKPLQTIKTLWIAIDAAAGGSGMGTITVTVVAAGVDSAVTRVLSNVFAAGLTWYQITAALPYTIASDVTTISVKVVNGQDGSISVYGIAMTD